MRRQFVLTTALVLMLICWASAAEGEGSQESSPRHTTGELVLGAGFGGFTSDLARVSNVGVAWDVRAGLEIFRSFGAELNYQGTSSGASGGTTPAGVSPGSHVTEQQVSIDAKLGYPLFFENRLLRPYGVAGFGYGHVSVDNIPNVAGIGSSNAAAFPLGVGLSYNITPGFLVDARYTYNILTGNTGNNWNVGFNLGADF